MAEMWRSQTIAYLRNFRFIGVNPVLELDGGVLFLGAEVRATNIFENLLT